MDNLSRVNIKRISRLTGTTLTPQHYAVLEYVYQYYQKNRVGPLYKNIKKNLGLTRKDIDTLFPHGLQSIYVWTGLPVQSPQEGCAPSLAEITVEHPRPVYLDHNATTPVRKEVVKALTEYYENPLSYGNPSSSSEFGKNAYEIVERARMQIADSLGVEARHIIFVSSGSEANNTALKGTAFRNLERKGHIITSKIEHASVLRPLEYLEQLGFAVTYLDVNKEGLITPELVGRSLRKDTILVAVMAANNEIGTINPIAEIGTLCEKKKVPFLVDGVQAYGSIPLRPRQMGISLLSLSGHKIYAPKGIGALYVKEGMELTPLIHGGGQEFGRRAGTENVGAIMAFGLAVECIHLEMSRENERLENLRDYLFSGLKKIDPGCILLGSWKHRLPQTLSVGFPDVNSTDLTLSLNRIGVYVSAGSACSSWKLQGSHVVKALGIDENKFGIVRFSLGLNSTREDLEYLLEYLPLILQQLRSC